MRAWLSFKLPEEREELETAQNGWKYESQVGEIWDRLFRPYYKHGYGKEIDNILLDPNARKLLKYLEEQYKDIIKET